MPGPSTGGPLPGEHPVPDGGGRGRLPGQAADRFGMVVRLPGITAVRIRWHAHTTPLASPGMTGSGWQRMCARQRRNISRREPWQDGSRLATAPIQGMDGDRAGLPPPSRPGRTSPSAASRTWVPRPAGSRHPGLADADGILLLILIGGNPVRHAAGPRFGRMGHAAAGRVLDSRAAGACHPGEPGKEPGHHLPRRPAIHQGGTAIQDGPQDGTLQVGCLPVVARGRGAALMGKPSIWWTATYPARPPRTTTRPPRGTPRPAVCG